jgi:MOSC domain-containing protein YiiM
MHEGRAVGRGGPVFTGVFKEPVTGPRRVRKLNVDGDGQGDLAGHGGEQRAVFVYQIDSYRYWERELGRDDFVYGQFGENFTVDGLATTRSASATATGSAPPSSRSRNPASPATASGSA